MKVSILLILVTAALAGLCHGQVPEGSDANEGKILFQEKCSQCHTIGDGRKVGPDLYGITQIRPMGYLVDIIMNATHVFQTGNPIAMMVLGQYRTIRMPNLNLSREQALDILACINEESARPRPEVRKEPVAGNPDTGRKLFDGKVWFKKGAPSCVSCHNISHLSFPMGGTMGPDLTDINARFAAVEAPKVFPTMIPLYAEAPLLPDEQQDLQAFITRAAFEQSTDVTAALALLAEAAFVLTALVVWLVWRNRIGVLRDSLRPQSARRRDTQ